MTVVSDAGPLIHLARAEHLRLLPALFGTILIPPRVHMEVCVLGAGQWGADEVRDADWVVQRPVAETAAVDALADLLDPGEAEAIILAQEVQADLVLLDGMAGREAARRLGLEPRGTLGVLAEGYRRGLVSDLRAAIQRMRERGTWLADDLVERFLGQVGA